MSLRDLTCHRTPLPSLPRPVTERPCPDLPPSAPVVPAPTCRRVSLPSLPRPAAERPCRPYPDLPSSTPTVPTPTWCVWSSRHGHSVDQVTSVLTTVGLQIQVCCLFYFTIIVLHRNVCRQRTTENDLDGSPSGPGSRQPSWARQLRSVASLVVHVHTEGACLPTYLSASLPTCHEGNDTLLAGVSCIR